jgi:hypothetical protein
VRWTWFRTKRDAPDDLPKANLEAAEEAKQSRLKDRKQAEAKSDYIDRLSRDLQKHGAENHFSEWILESMKRKNT